MCVYIRICIYLHIHIYEYKSNHGWPPSRMQRVVMESGLRNHNLSGAVIQMCVLCVALL